MPAPTITALSSNSLYIEWSQPSDQQINGEVVMYKLLEILDNDLQTDPFAPPIHFQVRRSSGADNFYSHMCCFNFKKFDKPYSGNSNEMLLNIRWLGLLFL